MNIIKKAITLITVLSLTAGSFTPALADEISPNVINDGGSDTLEVTSKDDGMSDHYLGEYCNDTFISLYGPMPDDCSLNIQESSISDADNKACEDLTGSKLNIAGVYDITVKKPDSDIYQPGFADTLKMGIICPDIPENRASYVFELKAGSGPVLLGSNLEDISISAMSTYVIAYESEGMKLVHKKLTVYVHGYTITAEGNMPENARLSVTEVFNYDTLEDVIGDEDYQIKKAFDIKIKAGSEIFQPVDFGETVNIAVTNPDIEEEDLKVYRIENEAVKNPDTVSDEAVVKIDAQINPDGDIELETEHFTVYTFGSGTDAVTINVPGGTKMAYMISGPDFNSNLKSFAGSAGLVKSVTVEKVTTSTKPSDSITVSENDSQYPVYAVFDSANGTITLKTQADRIYLNKNSSKMFQNFGALQTVSGIADCDTSVVTTMEYMFYGCSSLNTVGDLSGWDVSKVTNMNAMFRDCTKLQSVGLLKNWNTGSCTDMRGMFAKCYQLRTLDLSDWNVSKVKYFGYGVMNRSGMFTNSGVVSIGDLSGWDTSSCTDFSTMFYGCSNLESVGNLSGWNTSEVSCIGMMFYYCGSLKELKLSGWDMTNCTSLYYTFIGCSSLELLDMSGWDISNITVMESAFDELSSLKKVKAPKTILASQTIWLPADEEKWYIDDNEDCVSDTKKTYDSCINNITNLSHTYIRDDADGFAIGTVILTLKPGTEFNAAVKTLANGTSMTYENDDTKILAINCVTEPWENIEQSENVATDDSIYPIYARSVSGYEVREKKYSHTSNVNDNGNYSRIYGYGLATKDVINLPGAESLHVTLKYETDNGDMLYVFEGEYTGSVTKNMSAGQLATYGENPGEIATLEFDIPGDTATFAFYSNSSSYGEVRLGYYAIIEDRAYDSTKKTIELYHDPDIDAVCMNPNSANMFRGLKSIKNLSLPFSSKLVTNMDHMYEKCAAITSAPVLDDTSNVTTSYAMFKYCLSLETFDLNYDMSSNACTSEMFAGCTKLKSVTLGDKFDTSNVTNTAYIFQNCSALETLNLGNKFNTAKIIDIRGMFSYCRKLTELDISMFDLSSTAANLSKDIFAGCDKLKVIKAPKTIPERITVTLPDVSDKAWYTDTNEDLTADTWEEYTVMAAPVTNNSYVYVRSDLDGLSMPAKETCLISGPRFNNTIKSLSQGTEITEWEYDDNKITDVKIVYYAGDTAPEGSVCVSTSDKPFEVYAKFNPETNEIELLTAADLIYFNENSSYMFRGLNAATNLSILTDTKITTAGVTQMQHMFMNDKLLTTIDLSKFDTTSVVNMNNMFRNCGKMSSLIFGDSFDTSNVVEFGYMFRNCYSMTSINAPHIDTSSAVSMQEMFNNCNKLTTLDVSGFNTSKATNMNAMFQGCKSLTALDVSGFNTSNVTDMGHMFDGCEKIKTLDLDEFNTSKVTDLGGTFKCCASLGTVDLSRWVTSEVTTTETLFQECLNLKSVGDLSGWRLPKCETTACMFYKCSLLTDIGDISDWGMSSKLSNMSDMFYKCSLLTNIGDISGWDVSGCTDFRTMFAGCASLSSLDIENWVVSNGTEFSGMFAACNSLASINIKNWNVSNGTNFAAMFANCDNLETLDLSGWDVSNATAFDMMFASADETTHAVTGTSSLKEINISSWEINENASCLYMFYGDVSLQKIKAPKTIAGNKTIDLPAKTGCSWYLDDDRNLKADSWIPRTVFINNLTDIAHTYIRSDITGFAGYSGGNTTLIDGPDFNRTIKQIIYGNSATCTIADSTITCIKLANADAIPPSTNVNVAVDGEVPVYLVIDSGVVTLYTVADNIYMPEDASYMFASFCGLTSLDLGANFDTSNVTNMDHMFYSCETLTSLDLTGWDVSNNTDFGGMFYGCRALTSIEGLSGWNVSKGTDFSQMFYRCNVLTDIGDLSNWNVSNGTSFNSMFRSCNALTSLDLSGWNMSKATDFNGMFQSCSALRGTGDLSGWKVSNVTDFSSMFKGAITLKNIGNLSEWNVSGGTSFSQMFDSCSGLKDIGDLSGWVVSSSTDFSQMFYHCYAFTDIGDLSGWDVSNGTKFNGMFYGCKALTDIGNLSNWDVSNGTKFSGMFHDCRALTSIEGLSDWDVSNGTNFSQMFDVCESLTSLDLSNWDVSSGTNFDSMFSGCKALVSLKAPKTIPSDTSISLPSVTDKDWYLDDNGDLTADSKATYTTLIDNISSEKHVYIRSDIEGFTPCIITATMLDGPNFNVAVRNLTEPGADLDFGNYRKTNNTVITAVGWSETPFGGDDEGVIVVSAESSPTPVYARLNGTVLELYTTADVVNLNADCSSMFARLTKVQSIDMSRFTGNNLTLTGGMFINNNELKAIDVSMLDTSNVRDMCAMFQECWSLEELDVGSFRTGNAINMSYMFAGCNALKNLNVSGFDTSKATDMRSMFSRCGSITSLNLSSFDTSNVTIMHGMFNECSALASVNFGSRFNTSNVTDMGKMFYRCKKLTDLNIGTFSTTSLATMELAFSETGLTSIDLSGITISDGIIISSMFKDSADLTAVKLPESLTHYDNEMFSGCDKLSVVYGGQNVTSIGENAFKCTPSGKTEESSGERRILQFPDYESFTSRCWLDHDWQADNRSVCRYTVETSAKYYNEEIGENVSYTANADMLNKTTQFDITVYKEVGIEDVEIETDRLLTLTSEDNDDGILAFCILNDDKNANISSLQDEKTDLDENAETCPQITKDASGISQIKLTGETDPRWRDKTAYELHYLLNSSSIPKVGTYHGNISLHFGINKAARPSV